MKFYWRQAPQFSMDFIMFSTILMENSSFYKLEIPGFGFVAAAAPAVAAVAVAPDPNELT